MSSVTVRECFDQLSEVISHYKNNNTQHEYSQRCIKQDIAFVSQLLSYVYFRGSVPNLTQSEARKQCLPASDWLKFEIGK